MKMFKSSCSILEKQYYIFIYKQNFKGTELKWRQEGLIFLHTSQFTTPNEKNLVW